MTTPQDEELAQPRRSRRVPIVLACGAAVAIAGGVAVTAANAADTSGAAAASSSAPSGAPTGTPSSGTSRPTPPKRVPHIDGTVLSVSGTQILVKDPEGFTRTIVTSSATKYSDGLSASPKKGTELHAEGTVDANGTSLDATKIGKRPTPPAGGPGGHHGMGPGGPGGHGGPPAPPNGSKPSGHPSGSSSAPSSAPSSSTHS